MPKLPRQALQTLVRLVGAVYLALFTTPKSHPDSASCSKGLLGGITYTSMVDKLRELLPGILISVCCCWSTTAHLAAARTEQRSAATPNGVVQHLV